MYADISGLPARVEDGGIVGGSASSGRHRFGAAHGSERRRLDEWREFASHWRFGFPAEDGGLASHDGAPLLPAESFEPETSRRAVVSGTAVLRPTLDAAGRTVIVVYLPANRCFPGITTDNAPVAVLASVLHFGEALRLSARAFGMGNLAARLCVSLVENGSLGRASASCGITAHTAHSEIAIALHATGATNQCGLVHRLVEDWLCDPLDCEQAAGLLRSIFGLSARDARIASLRAAGYDGPETAKKLGLSQWAIKSSSSRIFTVLGVSKAPELTRILADLMLASDAADMLMAQTSYRAISACGGPG